MKYKAYGGYWFGKCFGEVDAKDRFEAELKIPEVTIDNELEIKLYDEYITAKLVEGSIFVSEYKENMKYKVYGTYGFDKCFGEIDAEDEFEAEEKIFEEIIPDELEIGLCDKCTTAELIDGAIFIEKCEE